MSLDSVRAGVARRLRLTPGADVLDRTHNHAIVAACGHAGMRPPVERHHATSARQAGARGPDRRVPTWAIISSGMSVLLLVGGWLVADAVQPSSYSPMRQTVSVLAGHGGHQRWIMTAALVGVGCCHLVTAAGLAFVSVSARVTLVVAGVAGLGIALSPEPVHGSTARHVAFTAVGAVAIAIWPALIGGRAGWRAAASGFKTTAIATAISLTLFAWLVAETFGGAELGAAERVTSSLQTCWPFVIVLTARLAPQRHASSAASSALHGARGKRSGCPLARAAHPPARDRSRTPGAG